MYTIFVLYYIIFITKKSPVLAQSVADPVCEGDLPGLGANIAQHRHNRKYQELIGHEILDHLTQPAI